LRKVEVPVRGASMSLAKRLVQHHYYTVRCSYCGDERTFEGGGTLEEAAQFFADCGFSPHPRSVFSCLCGRCAALYPDTRAIDDIEDGLPY
jgi:hypothetical protein